MNSPAFDTLQSVKAMREAGFNDTQSEVVVETMSRAMNQNLATKTNLLALSNDLVVVKTDLEKSISGVRLEIAGVRVEMEKNFGGLRGDMEKNLGELRTDMEKNFGELRFETAEGRADMEKQVGELRTEMTDKFETLYRRLWIMGISIIVANVTLVAAVMTLLKTAG